MVLFMVPVNVVFPAVDVIQVTVEGISPAAADWRGSLVSEKNFIA